VERRAAGAALPRGHFPTRWPTLWLWYLLAGLGAVAVYYLGPEGLLTSATYSAVGVSAAVAILIGTHIHRPSRRLPWVLMALGQLIWALADTIGSVWAEVDPDAFPTPADPVYLIGYPVTAAGIWLLIRGRRTREDRAGALDAAILTVSLGVLSWVLLARPTIATFESSPVAAAVAVSYPIADIVLAGLLIRLVTTPGGRTWSFRLLVTALVLLIVADTASSSLRLLTFDSTEPIDICWLMSYLAWGAAALHPSMVSLTATAPDTETTFTRRRLAALTVAVLVAPAVLAVESLLGIPPSVWAVVFGSVAVFALVMARMNLSIVQIQAANAERAAAQAELTHQAAHDSLTGLANRAQAMRLITAALSRAQRSGAVIGLLFIDLDGFKQVNDTLGHRAGDEVLRQAAGRMKDAVRAGDVVSRLGGDEFVVLLEPLDEQASAIGVAERLIEAVGQPMLLSDRHEARIGASVGVAISQDASTDADLLLSEADLAVYRAKKAGRGRVEVFDQDLQQALQRRATVEAALTEAIGADAVALRIEPVVELITGEPAGFEISFGGIADLVPDRRTLLSEVGRSPVVLDLDTWGLRRAASWLASQGPSADGLYISAPLTVRHLMLDRCLGDVDSALDDAGLSADRLMLLVSSEEITEDLRLVANLETLHARGVRICLDGFGGGTGPTSQWLGLPVSVVRLDSTTQPPLQYPSSGRPSGPTMLRLTAETARAFGYSVIVPALDDAESLAMAVGAGCEFGQGAAVLELLSDHRVPHGALS
jgi:diguanylate cyclase (GGDEF)-like protein